MPTNQSRKAPTITAYIHHTPAPTPAGLPLTQGQWYLGVRDGDRRGLLAGPYPTAPEADADMALVRALAERADPFSVFYAFGIFEMPTGFDQPGRLNDHLQAEKDRLAKEAEAPAAPAVTRRPTRRKKESAHAVHHQGN